MDLITDKSEIARQRKILDEIEKRFGPRILKILLRTVNGLSIENLQNPLAMEYLLQRETISMREVLDELNRRAYLVNGSSFANTYMPAVIASQIKPSLVTNSGTFAKRATGDVIPLIEKTTRGFVVEAGNTVTANLLYKDKAKEALAKAKADLGEISKAREVRITRTAGHSAAYQSHRDAAKEAGLEIVSRKWLTAKDDRVRPDHVAASGQEQQGTVPFIVGGERLQFPGDPNGSPKQIINCRCAERLFLR